MFCHCSPHDLLPARLTNSYQDGKGWTMPFDLEVLARCPVWRFLKAINELDELLETGFSGQEVKFVKKLIRELDAQEQKVDKKERKLRHRLFKIEADIPPVNVMFLYSTIDNIGAIADTAERVGNRLELLLAK